MGCRTRQTFGIHLADLPAIKPADTVFGSYHGIYQRDLSRFTSGIIWEGCQSLGDVKSRWAPSQFDHDASAAGADVAGSPHFDDGRLATSQEIAFALEGIIRSCGDAINWFSEQVAPLPDVAEICQEVLTSDSQEDIYFIPALQGMGALLG